VGEGGGWSVCGAPPLAGLAGLRQGACVRHRPQACPKLGGGQHRCWPRAPPPPRARPPPSPRPHLQVVDLSADFRLRDVATYAEW
jgi:hypothetical protein